MPDENEKFPTRQFDVPSIGPPEDTTIYLGRFGDRITDFLFFDLLTGAPEFEPFLARLVADIPDSNKTQYEYYIGLINRFVVDSNKSVPIPGVYDMLYRRGGYRHGGGVQKGFYLHTHPMIVSEYYENEEGRVLSWPNNPAEVPQKTKQLFLRNLATLLLPSASGTDQLHGDSQMLAGAIVAGAEATGYFMLHYNFQDHQGHIKYRDYIRAFATESKEYPLKYLMDQRWGELYSLRPKGKTVEKDKISFSVLKDVMARTKANPTPLLQELGLQGKS